MRFTKPTLSLVQRLLLGYLGIGLGTVAVVAWLFYSEASEALIRRSLDQLISVNSLKKNKVEDYFAGVRADVRRLATHPKLRGALFQNKDRKSALLELQLLFAGYGCANAILLDSNGKEIYRLNPAPFLSGIAVKNGKYGLSDLQLTNNEADSVGAYFYVREPTRFPASGSLVLVYTNKDLNRMLADRSGLGRTGESYLVGADRLMRSNSRFFTKSTVLNLKVETEAVKKGFAQNSRFTAIVEDYRKVKVLSTGAKIGVAGLEWLLLSEIDYVEVLEPIVAIQMRVLMLSAALCILITLFGLYTARRISKPILHFRSVIERLAEGNLPAERFPVVRQDEIGAMTEAVNRLAESMKRTTLFAGQIGNGNLNTDFQPLGPDDVLGRALLEMREKLRLLAEAEKLHRRARQEGEENERKRISRELHDGVGQMLTALKFKMDSLPISEEARKMLLVHIDNTISEVRRISHNLMPSLLVDFGLEAALKRLCNDAASGATSQINFEFHNYAPTQRLNPEYEIALYRIAQEAIHNAIKYSKAQRIEVTVELSEDELALTVQDHGVGFDIEAVKHVGGLQNMKERAGLVGGTFKIRSQKENGTAIRVTIPLVNEKCTHSNTHTSTQ